MFILGNHQEVIENCEGCLRIIVRIGDGMRICSCRPFPHMEWLCGKCKDSLLPEDMKKKYQVE